MSEFDKNLGKALDIFNEDIKQEILPPEQKDDDRYEDDYEYARRNLRELVDSSLGEIHSILDIARKSESPRAYEVAANLIRTLAETNKDLMSLAKDKKALKENKNEKSTPTEGTVNNNLFVGSTKDLQDFIDNLKSEKDGN
jgi:retron-type reverse transcriptase